MNDALIAAGFAIAAVAVPYGLVLLRSYVNAHVKNTQLNTWANGAISFAGQAYIDLVASRQANPTTPLKQLVNEAVQKQATEFLASYKETADKLGATKDDAVSKVAGALGDKLANDPTVSVAPVELQVAKPVTLSSSGIRS